MSDTISKEEMRKARLRALGQQQGGGSGKEIEGNGPPETEEEGWMVVDATDLPPSNPSASPAAPAATASSDGRPMTDAEMDAIRGLMWPPSATGDDLSRWHNQGFIFPPSLPPSLTFGLAQGQGGPCGVLAAVQGEVVRLLVFEGRDEHGKEGGEEEGVEGGKEDAALPTPDAAGALQALARALIHVLERARPTERELEEEGVGSNSSSSSNNSSSSSSTDSSNNKNNNSSRSERGQIYLVTPSLPPSLPSSLPPSFASSSSSSFVLSPHTPPRELEIRTFPHAQAAVEFLTERGGLAPFQSPAGVLLFIYSLLLTRGSSLSRGDTDDPEQTTLTGRFGHCSQELLNLLLMGRATSNVFDGDKELGDSGLKLRGVSSRATIGYLTHLEALRYVQVGSHYKTPHVPIWVVGSSSHFTVLFALEKGCNEESRGEELLARVQRVFQTHDPSEGGFIQTSDLQQVLIELDLLSVALDEREMEKMITDLEVQGAGIVLFDPFWQKISPLLFAKQGGGSSGMDVVHEAEEEDNNSSDTGSSCSPSSLPTSLPTSFPPATFDHQGEGGGEGGRARSDSEIARELQAQFDEADEAAAAAAAGLSNLSAPAPPPSSPTHATAARVVEEDEENGEEQLPASSTAAAAAAAVKGGGGGVGGGRGGRLMRSSSITGPLSFTLYHYNGLSSGGRSPTLTRFLLTKAPRQGTAALVGHSVALGTSPMGSGAAFSCPIEEVLATKWPGARFDWLGAAPPSID